MPEDLLTGVSTAAKNAIFTRVGDLVTEFWDFSLGAVVNFIFLGKNARKLEEEMKQLKDLRCHVNNTAEVEALQPMKEVSTRVLGWITRVDNLGKEVAIFQESYGTQSICVTGFCLGYDAVQLQRQVEKLMEQGNAFGLSGFVMPRHLNAFPVVTLEIPSSTLVGVETTMLEIQGHIMDDAVGVIGICGMGGAGKTTLLKVINNNFLREEQAKDKFNMSIWVTVSRTVGILGIQKLIGDRLGLSLSSGGQGEPPDENLRREQADSLSRLLSKKRFILFLDEIREKIEWEEIGIPRPEETNKHKVLFTTRDESVCGGMGADKIVKVRLLNPEDSWTLFQLMGKSADVETKKKKDNPDVREIAKHVVEKCGGLPMSLVAVGRAMASATTIEAWSNALHSLNYCAEEVSGMDEVLANLKFSFDMLNNTSLQSCLLYCAFYPENKDILKKEIIDYWISEGFLDPEGYMDTHIGHTRNRGHEWIRQLQNACLLEGGIEYGEQAVRLHDTIRDMLQMIGRETYVMLFGDDIARIPKKETWESAKGISLINNSTNPARFFRNLKCTALTSLLLRGSFFVKTIEPGFFACTLRVLDLSSTQIKALPSDIATLVELRYLNLSHTPIESLPEVLDKLSNLTYLNLEHTSQLRSIPKEAVSGLTSLQVLKMRESAYSFSCSSELRLSDLDNLSLLCELTATVKACSPSLHPVSNTLSKCIRDLQVDLCVGHPLNTNLTFDPEQLPNLELLKFLNFREAEIVVIYPVSLGYSIIPGSRDLREVTWEGRLPRLKVIEKTTEPLLDICDLSNDGCIIFTKLKSMVLRTHKLEFPSLE